MKNSICHFCNLDIYFDLDTENSAEVLVEKLRCHSFVILRNHNFPINLLTKIYSEWKNFFESDEKFNWIRSDLYDEGYVPLNTEIAKGSSLPDFKEFYETHYNGILPNCIDTTLTKVFLESFLKLTERVFSLIDSAIPMFIKNRIGMSFGEMISGNNNHMLRVIHYPPINTDRNSERAAAHGDACLFTILPVATCRGLEFQHSDDCWFEPKIQDSEIIMFNSDMVDLCTDGYFKSAIHRVTSISSDLIDARYSIPFFVHPRRNVILQNEITAYEFLKKRLIDIGYDGHKLINNEK